MKKNNISIKKIISYLILAVFLAFAAVFVKNHPEILNHLKMVSFLDFMVISSFVIAVLILNGLRTKVLTEVFGIPPLRFLEWFGLSMINTLGNYSPFRGGIVARGYYLKNYYKLLYSHFYSSMLASYFITFMAYSTVGIIASFIMFFFSGIFYWIVFLLFIGLLILGAFFIFYLPKISISHEKGKFYKYIDKFLDGWRIIRNNNSCLLKLAFLDLLTVIVISLRFYYVAVILGFGITFFQSVVVSLLAMFVMVINITPGALGIREALAGFTMRGLGSQFNTGLIISGIERAVILIWVFSLGLIFGFLFTSEVNKNKLKEG